MVADFLFSRRVADLNAIDQKDDVAAEQQILTTDLRR